jgi:hypothetical protein
MAPTRRPPLSLGFVVKPIPANDAAASILPR